MWGTPAIEHPTDRDGRSISSARTGGMYFVSGSAESLFERMPDKRLRARLTTWLIEQRRLGNYCPDTSTEVIVGPYQSKRSGRH